MMQVIKLQALCDGREGMVLSNSCIIHLRIVAGMGGLIRGVVDGDSENEKDGCVKVAYPQVMGEKKAGTDEIRTREVSHHGLVKT
jgi:hypothetical protein